MVKGYYRLRGLVCEIPESNSITIMSLDLKSLDVIHHIAINKYSGNIGIENENEEDK